MAGRIFLIPSMLGEGIPELVLPDQVVGKVHKIKHFVVENTRSARRFLIRIKHPIRPDNLFFHELDKHNPEAGIGAYIQLCEQGEDIGIISEAGMPGIADPGSLVVKAGHQKGIKIIPLTGPSSIFLALSASGMNGQNFIFHGYLPLKKEDRSLKIKEMEFNSGNLNQTQIFIETPYRNSQLLDDLLRLCHKNTLLCIACQITMDDEFIITHTILEWQKNKPDISKKPCVFLLMKV
jgi:16S rRNA (cytidine1402-2'-O)-methyltransferase